MSRPYYSTRKRPGTLTLRDLYSKLANLYMLFREKDWFLSKARITTNYVPDAIKHEAAVALMFDLFPVTKWPAEQITEDHVFDALEFFYDYVSKPGEQAQITDSSGYTSWDYLGHDDEAGRADYRKRVNVFLADYKSGFELTEDGTILSLGTGGLQYILDAEIVPYDEVNVDSKVRSAITKWRNRHLGLAEKKEAIRELADVFEWLKKSKGLSTVLDGKDESAIFELANNFAIRHHDPKQKRNYDQAIWYSWIFHFYLATYHASVRLLIKKETRERRPGG